MGELHATYRKTGATQLLTPAAAEEEWVPEEVFDFHGHLDTVSSLMEETLGWTGYGVRT